MQTPCDLVSGKEGASATGGEATVDVVKPQRSSSESGEAGARWWAGLGTRGPGGRLVVRFPLQAPLPGRLRGAARPKRLVRDRRDCAAA